jgi:outer membrane protein TolC
MKSITLIILVFLSLNIWNPIISFGQEPTPPVNTNKEARDIPLQSVLQRVLTHNLSISAALRKTKAARNRALGEYGIFEPSLVASVKKEATSRRNSTEEAVSQSVIDFEEENIRYKLGIEGKLPTGLEYEISGTRDDLNNNLQLNEQTEYRAGLGGRFKQPLLRDFGFPAAMVQIRLAAQKNKMVLHDTRRQLIEILAAAEDRYYIIIQLIEIKEAQRKHLVKAEELLAISKEEVTQAGGSIVSQYQAQINISQRRISYYQSIRDLQAAMEELAVIQGFKKIQPIDGYRYPAAPELEGADAMFAKARIINPQILKLNAELKSAEVNFAQSVNQVLPRLDVVGEGGHTGLALTPDEAYTIALDKFYPYWAIGLEFKVPLALGIRERNEVSATRQDKEGARESLDYAFGDLDLKIKVGIDKVNIAERTAEETAIIERMNRNLFDAEMTMLIGGSGDLRRVTRAQADWLESQVSLIKAQYECYKRRLELEADSGLYLQSRNLDIL